MFRIQFFFQVRGRSRDSTSPVSNFKFWKPSSIPISQKASTTKRRAHQLTTKMEDRSDDRGLEEALFALIRDAFIQASRMTKSEFLGQKMTLQITDDKIEVAFAVHTAHSDLSYSTKEAALCASRLVEAHSKVSNLRVVLIVTDNDVQVVASGQRFQ